MDRWISNDARASEMRCPRFPRGRGASKAARSIVVARDSPGSSAAAIAAQANTKGGEKGVVLVGAPCVVHWVSRKALVTNVGIAITRAVLAQVDATMTRLLLQWLIRFGLLPQLRMPQWRTMTRL